MHAHPPSSCLSPRLASTVPGPPRRRAAPHRHVPKFLQAHAHMLNKSVEEEPEAAALAQKFDDGKAADGQEDEGEDDDEQARACWRDGGGGGGVLAAGAGSAWAGPTMARLPPTFMTVHLPAAACDCCLPLSSSSLQEALRRAIELDPSLLQQHPELQSVADRAEAEAIKAQGNAAFQAGKLEEAAALFGRCIELDGSSHIYYSNRAAALTGLKDYKVRRCAGRAVCVAGVGTCRGQPGRFSLSRVLTGSLSGRDDDHSLLEQDCRCGGTQCNALLLPPVRAQGAARDARRCTELKPGWAKGWSRLGAAYYGLEQFSDVSKGVKRHAAACKGCDGLLRPAAAPLRPRPAPAPAAPAASAPQAREAYERACKLEPSDTQLQVSLQKAAAREGKQIAEHKHTFKRTLELDEGGSGGGSGARHEKRQQLVKPSAAKKEKTLLSFGEEEEEGEA